MSICFYHRTRFTSGLAIRTTMKNGQKVEEVFDTTPKRSMPDEANKYLLHYGRLPKKGRDYQ